MSSKAMSLKARIRNLAERKNIAPQVLLQNYMFERFLDRLSKSAYQDKFILKGGMLIAAIVGLEKRSTMDLDTTLRRLPRHSRYGSDWPRSHSDRSTQYFSISGGAILL